MGDTIWFRAGQDGVKGTNATFSDNDNFYRFIFGTDDSIAAGGNVMSLYDGSCQQDSMTSYGFYKLFCVASALTTAPLLPATQLDEYCYCSMFDGCGLLTTAPSLPATQLASNCYCCMFDGCVSLTTAPSLPATQLVDGCYCAMFANCISLTIAPSLTATQLAGYCYWGMFNGCTSLRVDTCDGNCAGAMLVVPDTTQVPKDWNKKMFNGCLGDSAYTAVTGIRLGGRYCMMGTNFTLTVEANDTTMGSVTGGGIYDCGDTVTITATAKEGYKFVSWSTGDTVAALTFLMFNQDTTITATFAPVSAVGNVEVERYVACVESGSIIVKGVAECTVAIYDINGRLVGKVERASDIERFAVGAAGVYVISVDYRAETRVIVK